MQKILIFGTGAVGSVYGVKLARAGYDVSFYVKQEQKQTLQKTGIELETLFTKKKFKLSSLNIMLIDELKSTDQFDYVILCVRFEQQEDAIKQLKKVGLHTTNIVALQTGISSLDKLSEEIKNLIVFAPG